MLDANGAHPLSPFPGLCVIQSVVRGVCHSERSPQSEESRSSCHSKRTLPTPGAIQDSASASSVIPPRRSTLTTTTGRFVLAEIVFVPLHGRCFAHSAFGAGILRSADSALNDTGNGAPP